MYKINKTNKTTVEIKFTADKKEWEEAVQSAYEKKKGEYNIPGFRKGQAPRKLIEKTYGESVFFEEAFAIIAEKSYADALTKDETINPIGDPDLKLDKFVEGELEGTITLTVVPEVKLGKYKGLNVEANFIEYNESMLNDELEHAREHMTVSKEVEGKVSETGDVVVIDFLGTLDGVPFDGGKAENYELLLGSHSFIDTFEDQLTGHKAGEHVVVNVTFPKDYGAKNLADKKAVFDCDIKAVKVQEKPELNDEFAKSMGDYENLDAYKKDVEEQIKHELGHRNEQITEDAILDAIVETSEIELPEILVNKQLDAIMQDLNYRLTYQGMSLEAYADYLGITVDALREQHRKDAERVAKTKQVLEALVKAEKCEVTEKEVDEKLEEFAKMSDKSLEEYKKIVEPRRLNYIYSDILMSKVMGMLKENNKVVAKQNVAKKEAPAKKTETAKKPAEKKTTTKTTEKKTTKTTKDEKAVKSTKKTAK